MAKPSPETTPIYTRDEMREACRNNYNAALEKAALIVMRVRAGSPPYNTGGAPLQMCIDAIRALKEQPHA